MLDHHSWTEGSFDMERPLSTLYPCVHGFGCCMLVATWMLTHVKVIAEAVTRFRLA